MSKEVDVLFWLMLAIERRKVVKIKYANSSERQIEPYVLGENGMKEVMLRAYDLDKNDWRLFNTGKITV